MFIMMVVYYVRCILNHRGTACTFLYNPQSEYNTQTIFLGHKLKDIYFNSTKELFFF
jgi:hypothetical protein